MKEKAVEYFKNGYSCSESLIKAAIDEGLCPSELMPVATAFQEGCLQVVFAVRLLLHK